MDWRRVTHESGISCEIGRLTWRQKPLVAAMVTDVLGPLAGMLGPDGKPTAELVADATAVVRGSLDKLDDAILRPLFKDNVRDVKGCDAANGEELLDQAPDIGFVIWMLRQFIDESSLKAEEGKASASPSTSSTDQTGDSVSPAPSTTPADGPSHSTAPAMSPGKVSSSQVA